MPNRLSSAISPYLLQHAGNPVDWYPWSAEALDRAREEDKPIFLSIGYSACHWCHVMAHESFENGQIARLLNEYFVPIKVDREERPELDQLYMEAVQLMTGNGGWPLSVFLTPSLQPFFGGTYWPPQSRGGMPGFDQVLRAVADAWKNRRDEALEHAERLTQLLRDVRQSGESAGPPAAEPGPELLRNADAVMARSFDPHDGGFGTAPKFPHPLDLRLLLRSWRRTDQGPLLSMVTTTLDQMAAGGIYDHLGGGFHRYATDARWLVPHFEKMLYDNALLAVAYLEGWQATHAGQYARVVRETLDYVLREMTAPEGGFYSTEDADSEGEEGKFYLWTPAEVAAVLGPQAAHAFCHVYDVSEPGNFEGRNILHRSKTLGPSATILGRPLEELEVELASSRRRLMEARSARVRPGRDDKVLVSWNGLTIDALARSGAALGEPRYVDAAASAARFLLSALRSREGSLLHVWRGGEARHDAFLDDYASLANALVSLYEARFEENWIDEAAALADEILRRFHDPAEGGFFYTAAGQESLIARKKDMLDSSVPSGGGLATMALLRLGKLCGRNDYLEAARQSLRACTTLMERSPVGSGQMLLALDFDLGPTAEIVLFGSEDRQATADTLAFLGREFVPNKVVAFRDERLASAPRSPALSAIFAGKQPLPPGPTLFVCEHFSCQSPVTGGEVVGKLKEFVVSGQ
jgi:uncharacterized protein YyaL (SSP411 family)